MESLAPLARCSGKGSIYVTKDLQIRGNARIVDSYSSDDGGAVHVSGSVEQHSGSLAFANCSSQKSGGAIYVKEGYAQLGGSLSIVDSYSSGAGGAVYVSGSVEQHSGSLAFANCSSQKSGGAVYVAENYTQLAGSVFFANCSSVGDDTAAAAYGELTKERALKTNEDEYKYGGGGLFVGEILLQKAGWMRFEDCSTNFHGGGLLAARHSSKPFVSAWVNSLFHPSSFLVRNQPLESIRLLQSGRAAMSFRNCAAAGRGGGAAVAGRAKVQGGLRGLRIAEKGVV